MSSPRLFKTKTESSLLLLNNKSAPALPFDDEAFKQASFIVKEFFEKQLQFTNDMEHVVNVFNQFSDRDPSLKPYEELLALKNPLTIQPTLLSDALTLITDTIQEKNDTFQKIMAQMEECIKQFPHLMEVVQKIQRKKPEIFQKISNALEHKNLSDKYNPEAIRSELIKPFQAYLKIHLFLSSLLESLPASEKHPLIDTWKEGLQTSIAFIKARTEQFNAAQAELTPPKSPDDEKPAKKKSIFSNRKLKGRSTAIVMDSSPLTLRKSKSE